MRCFEKGHLKSKVGKQALVCSFSICICQSDRIIMELPGGNFTLQNTVLRGDKNFGERIRKKRMDLGLTMREFAGKLGVTETTVYNWEIRNIKPYCAVLSRARYWIASEMCSVCISEKVACPLFCSLPARSAIVRATLSIL